MKKFKSGFTLAEVLITLAIIGVVATLTLPALMTNTAEQQAKTALKKGINTLTEAGQMNQAIAGFDYASLTSTAEGDNEQSLIGLLRSRANVDLRISGNSSTEAAKVNAGASNYVVFFRDGSALSFNRNNTLMGSGKVGNMQNDGLVYGVTAVYDTNGAKGPNLLSNCKGSATMTNASNNDSTADDHNAQCSKANRVIKDQFGVRLRGGYAFPNGAAARWAFEN
jgi:prepilin-type N-terminal cleavage/methylation domain-containing protein